MSWRTQSFLSLCPRVERCGDELHARTSILGVLLSLGLSCRRVIVDPVAREIRLRKRSFWLWPSERRVWFDEIERLEYEYDDLLSIGAWVRHAHDSLDCFDVRLRLRCGERVHVFSFVGEGELVNESIFPDWMMWDDFVTDLHGAQESESRAFVTLLKELTGATLT